MINYFEKARELGALILESELSLRLADARAAYETDEEAKAMLSEYTEYEERIREGMENGALLKDEFRQATKRLTEMGASIKKSRITGELIQAENDFNFFVNQIVGVLKATITGDADDTGSCGGQCGGCNGCGN